MLTLTPQLYLQVVIEIQKLYQITISYRFSMNGRLQRRTRRSWLHTQR